MQQRTLIDLGEMKDCQFMTADEKRKVLKQWNLFLKSGLSKEKFTKSLYHHLTLHCEFIAHYSIDGFYSTYFDRGDDTVHFLSQFDDRNGPPRSIEYRSLQWIFGGNDVSEGYYDINNEMVRIAGHYLPALIEQARLSQRNHDLALAEELLAKHGR